MALGVRPRPAQRGRVLRVARAARVRGAWYPLTAALVFVAVRRGVVVVALTGGGARRCARSGSPSPARSACSSCCSRGRSRTRPRGSTTPRWGSRSAPTSTCRGAALRHRPRRRVGGGVSSWRRRCRCSSPPATAWRGPRGVGPRAWLLGGRVGAGALRPTSRCRARGRAHPRRARPRAVRRRRRVGVRRRHPHVPLRLAPGRGHRRWLAILLPALAFTADVDRRPLGRARHRLVDQNLSFTAGLAGRASSACSGSATPTCSRSTRWCSTTARRTRSPQRARRRHRAAPCPEHDADHVVDAATSGSRAGLTNRLGAMLAPMGVRYVVAAEHAGPRRWREPARSCALRGRARQLDLAAWRDRAGLVLYENLAWIRSGGGPPPRPPGRRRRPTRRAAWHRLARATCRSTSAPPDGAVVSGVRPTTRGGRRTATATPCATRGLRLGERLRARPSRDGVDPYAAQWVRWAHARRRC